MNELLASQQKISLEAQEGTGPLRRDLVALRTYLQQTTGQPGLAAGLEACDIRRVLELGVGSGPDAFEAIKNLSNLQRRGVPLFSKENLWAIDPSVSFNDAVLRREYGVDPASFTKRSINIQKLAEDIEEGIIPPFDMVFARGVVSIGNLGSLSRNPKVMAEEGRKIIQAMKECLSSQPDALLLACTKFPDTILPLLEVDFENTGLQVVYLTEARGEIARDWIKMFQKRGIFPKDSKEKFFNLVICKASLP